MDCFYQTTQLECSNNMIALGNRMALYDIRKELFSFSFLHATHLYIIIYLTGERRVSLSKRSLQGSLERRYAFIATKGHAQVAYNGANSKYSGNIGPSPYQCHIVGRSVWPT